MPWHLSSIMLPQLSPINVWHKLFVVVLGYVGNRSCYVGFRGDIFESDPFHGKVISISGISQLWRKALKEDNLMVTTSLFLLCMLSKMIHNYTTLSAPEIC